MTAQSNAFKLSVLVVSWAFLCCVQLVILLYLLDNNTSFIILASSAVGLVIEFWKVRGWNSLSLLLHHKNW